MISGILKARALSALAMATLVPTLLLIEAELASRAVGPPLPEEQERLERAVKILRTNSPLCSREADESAGLSGEKASRLLRSALNATFAVNRAFTSDTLFWTFDRHLPWTAGLSSVYEASIASQAHLARLEDEFDFCRRVEPGDEAAVLEEEQRSQAWLNAELVKLQGLADRLAAARAAYEQDRPKLTALAWSLGLLQVVGWGLLLFVVLPRDYGSWRERRASRKGIASGSNHANREEQSG